MNFITGEIVRDRDPQFRARGDGFVVPLPVEWRETVGQRGGGSGQRGLEVVLGIRPEDVGVAVPSADGSKVRMRLDLVEPMGNEVFVHASAGDHEMTARVPPQPLPDPGAEVALTLNASRMHFFDAATRETLRAEPASS